MPYSVTLWIGTCAAKNPFIVYFCQMGSNLHSIKFIKTIYLDLTLLYVFIKNVMVDLRPDMDLRSLQLFLPIFMVFVPLFDHEKCPWGLQIIYQKMQELFSFLNAKVNFWKISEAAVFWDLSVMLKLHHLTDCQVPAKNKKMAACEELP